MRACVHYNVRRLRQVRRRVSRPILKQLVHSFVVSGLDYCNCILAGLLASSLAKLQRVQNAAARLVLGLRAHDHVTAALRELHWLAVKYRIQCKLCLLMHSVSTLNSAIPGLSQSTSSVCRQLNLSSRTEVVEQSVLCSPKNSNKTG